MSPTGTRWLSLDQAPPLEIPVGFFVTLPVAVLAAGVLLASGTAGLRAPFHPATIALAHIGTLGFLAMAMFGAVLQMLPVVVASPVAAPRLAHGVHGLLVGGLGLAAAGLIAGSTAAAAAGGVALGAAVLGFVGLASLALMRAPSTDPTVWGMRLAVLSLLAVATLGLWMGQGHAGGAFPGSRASWTQVHLLLGLLGWVGTLLVAVSWKVIPMFYLTADARPRQAWAALVLIAVGLGGVVAGLVGGASPPVTLGLCVPAVLVVWLWHPVVTLWALRHRRRPRADASLWFWAAGMGCGLLCGPLALAAVVAPGRVFPALFAWVAVWGWAGLVVHGMLCRIVPFLVWFHRLSHLVGIVEVPPMRRILPDRLARRGLWVHLASVVIGVVAILVGSEVLLRLCGVSLVVVAVALGHELLTALRVRAPAVPSE